ncbi:MAG: response regulator [Scytolyngbya sp. HA4215-MV1]|jgi:CheY-like chemotaxis protein|nr:response regulator [Scytolyngbya sp. HA4215-MV1]
MADSQKLVLMVQPTRLQGLIWQSVLKSQQISVIWETPDTNLIDNINLLKEAELTLPDLLLVDVKVPDFNPYEFCRWCRENHPSVKVVLTDVSVKEISRYERRWAIYQGAADLLPGFQRENLVSSVASSVKRVLEVMDSYPLNNGALISVLLSMKRQLESRMSDRPSLPVKPAVITAVVANDPKAFVQKALEKDAAPLSSPQGSPLKETEEVVIQPAVTSNVSLPQQGIREEDPPPVRRYRGVTY